MKIIYRHPETVDIGGRKVVGIVVFGLLVLLSILVGAASGLLLVYSTDLPQVEELERYRPSSITELYDGQGRVIGTFALQRRVVASYDDYPEVLRNALISIEDKDFYRHSGINVWRIAGAAYRDIESGGKVQGASTLTMQLARNLFLSPDRSFYRKVQEALLLSLIHIYLSRHLRQQRHQAEFCTGKIPLLPRHFCRLRHNLHLHSFLHRCASQRKPALRTSLRDRSLANFAAVLSALWFKRLA